MQSSIWRAPQFLRGRAESDVWNALLSYREQPLKVREANAALRFSEAGAPELSRWALLIKPQHGPDFLAVVEAFPFQQMFGVELGLPEIPALPAPLRGCLEEGMLSMVWQAFPALSKLGEPSIVSSGPMTDMSAGVENISDIKWLYVTIEGVAPAPVGVLIGFSVSAFAGLVSHGILAQSAVGQQLAASLAIDLYHTLGSLCLTYSQLSGLEPGDVVVLPYQAADQRLARADDVLFTVKPSGSQFVCVNRELAERYRQSVAASGGIKIMKENGEDTADGPSTVGELKVIIDFDIGRTTVPLAEMQSWQPGTAVHIDPPAIGDNVSVTVRANGQVIGSGDLVQIDDRIAVRLTRLSFRDGADSAQGPSN